MPTYITLMNYTKQGIQNIKESPDRLEAARAAIERTGGRIVGFYLTMGQYDAVIITEGPDDETTTKILPVCFWAPSYATLPRSGASCACGLRRRPCSTGNA